MYTLPMKLADPTASQVTTDAAVAQSMMSLENARVLDLGCGTAAFARKVAEKHPAAKVTALEVDRQQHAKNLASEKPANLEFGRGGAEEIPYDDGTFDLVSMIKSLHHVPQEQIDRAFKEMHRVLKPGGRAFILEPVFMGDFNEVIRVYHDEEKVRLAAFEATKRAVDSGLFELVEERHFLTENRYRDFAEFERKHIGVTHTDHHLTPEQYAEVQRRFAKHATPEGAKFLQPLRVDLLAKKPL